MSPDRRLAATCPICTQPRATSIDAPRSVPVLMNRTYADSMTARGVAHATLAVARCEACGFVWNSAYDPRVITYDRDYENDQTHSPAFLAHLAERAADVVGSVPEGLPLDVLEVGCGQGRFLTEIARQSKVRLRSLEGFDPAWRGPDGEGPEGARIHRAYFDAQSAGRLQHPPNVVVTRHTIEHVPDPVAFLAAIRSALGSTSRADVFVETPCIDWILSHEALQDFCYEHCSLFTAGSLAQALRRAGFAAASVTHVFGGQYLWARGSMAPADAPASRSETPVALPWIDDARDRFIARWRRELAVAASHGRVALWGASTKGVTFAMLTDPDARLIDHIVDINPAKQGRHVGVTGLPILSPQESAARAPDMVFLMNPNYRTEVQQTLDGLGSRARLLPIN